MNRSSVAGGPAPRPALHPVHAMSLPIGLRETGITGVWPGVAQCAAYLHACTHRSPGIAMAVACHGQAEPALFAIQAFSMVVSLSFIYTS